MSTTASDLGFSVEITDPLGSEIREVVRLVAVDR
jgi:hypothetical protein